MLIEFRVANFRSLRDEQAITLEADPEIDSEDIRLRSSTGHDCPLLPIAVIYGSNASGKSNLLAALGFMRTAVLHSADLWPAGHRIPRTAFAWAGRSAMPSLFEVTLLLDQVKYQYGFQLDDYSILEEWLFKWDGLSRVRIFEREHQRLECPAETRPFLEAVAAATQPSGLYLSAGRVVPHTELGPLQRWFERILIASGNAFSPAEETREHESWLPGVDGGHSQGWRHTLDFLRSLDLGIVDIKLAQQAVPGGTAVRRILVKHSTDENSWLDLSDESRGTQCLIQLAPYIIRAIETGGLLLVDELESSLHPLIGLAIIRLFSDPSSNPHHAQVLFTTHDTRMLGTTLGDPTLRRDQVWFAEKDKEGASVIYPLTDFRSSDCENLERGYLQGRYGAIPYCGSFSWNEE